ncbi:hypothetical protein [Spirosoma litoris]
MKDITQQVKSAIYQNSHWSISLFFNVIENMRRKGYEISYWENEENWAIVLVENKPIGYLWQKHPLFFIKPMYFTVLKDLLFNDGPIEIIEVDDFVGKLFKIDYHLLNDQFDFGIDPERFSIEDLWFYSNSK